MKSIKQRKRVGLYSPYLKTLGGGERHILSILRVIQECGYDVEIFSDTDLTSDFEEKLNLRLRNVRFKSSKMFRNGSFIKKLIDLHSFDLFLYVTDGSYFFSSAKKTLVFCMVPQKNLYRMNIVNRLKTANQRFVSNSFFTKNNLSSWGITSDVIYPYLDAVYFENEKPIQKERSILVVGRFFQHLHSKRHDIAISWFQNLKKTHSEFNSYKLILVGSTLSEDKDYVEKITELIGNDSSIEMKTNCSFAELLMLYRTSQFYWHFTGFGINEKNAPERVEHLGITPLEAMATGCITCAYRAGGLKEIIENGKTGILFQTKEELFSEMLNILKHQQAHTDMKNNAQNLVKNTFSYEIFKKRVIEVLEL